jgi:hypothetical protein
MSEDYLRRYTDLTALIYLLHQRKITLLDPSSWDDKNDSLQRVAGSSLAGRAISWNRKE